MYYFMQNNITAQRIYSKGICRHKLYICKNLLYVYQILAAVLLCVVSCHV